jgi:hypothetical protein
MSLSAPTQVYYNLDVANEQIGGLGVPPAKLSFTEVRSSNLLDTPSDYFMSIVRFSVDTAGSLPIFIPQIDTTQVGPGAPNTLWPNLTTYKITLSYEDAAGPNPVSLTTQTEPVIYIPHRSDLGVLQNQILRPPPFVPLNPAVIFGPGAMTLESATSEYYWVQSWGQWIAMLNETLARCYANLRAAVSAAVPLYVFPLDYDIDNPPFFRWDDSTCKMSFVSPYFLFNQGGTAVGTYVASPPYNFPDAYDAKTTAYNAQSPALVSNAKMNLFFNAPLHILFSSFEWVFNSYTSNIGEAFMMRVYNKMGANFERALPAYVPPVGPPMPAPSTGIPGPKQSWDALVMEQEYGTGPTMCPVARIVFLASLIPVLPSNIGVPRIFSGSVAVQAQQNNNISNEITDLIVNLVRGDEYLPNIIYEPTAEYRLLDLQGNTPAQAIQIKVQWVDIYGYYHDFYLQNGCGANLKIMFRKKAFNNISS